MIAFEKHDEDFKEVAICRRDWLFDDCSAVVELSPRRRDPFAFF